jgi:signal transduction histidine kinase
MEDLLELGRSIRKENMRPVKLKPFLDEALISWRQSAHQECQIIELDASKADPLWAAELDPNKIMQVVTNLLENAAQHSPRDKPIVMRLEPGENNWAEISIIDQGKGIPEENLQKMFEPFFTTRRGGTGLGLSIVKRIVESHSGRIEIHNNSPEPGVTVQIHLPLLEKA